jgi:hypothetical protein
MYSFDILIIFSFTISMSLSCSFLCTIDLIHSSVDYHAYRSNVRRPIIYELSLKHNNNVGDLLQDLSLNKSDCCTK